jgi:transcriptional regulator with XRE-family HTH domain
MDLGERLKQLRKARNMKQRDLERLANLPETAVSKIENGSRKMDAVELLAIAQALHLPLEAFSGGSLGRRCTASGVPSPIVKRTVKRALKQITTVMTTLSATLDNL